MTQLDIARLAGVHNTTVSLALRNSPAIPAATRQRIQAVAEALGYRPDPALQALASYRKAVALPHRVESIAYLTSGTTRWGWREIAAEEQYFAGAERKATERGYKLEHFWLSEPGMNPRRMSQILFSRGITGVIFAPYRVENQAPVDLEWERFSSVKIGLWPTSPGLHCITNDRGSAVRLALQRALAAGYRRPALMLPERLDVEADSAWSLAFITEQIRLSFVPRIPVFQVETADNSVGDSPFMAAKPEETARLATWFAEFRPDVVLGFQPLAPAMLSAVDLSAPQDVAFIDLFHETDDPAIAGIRQNCDCVGAIAVELLAGQLQQNLRGIPAVPTTTFVAGAWRDGASLPRIEVGEGRAATIDRSTPLRNTDAAA